MKFSDVELPSNKKFGYFFTLVFVLLAVYFFTKELILLTYIMSLTSAIFLVFSITKAELLLPLNKLWMRFGLLLAMIVSPIVLSTIFFGLFTPIALVMRLSRRDELRLKFYKKQSHWIVRREPIKSESFKHQF
ncbi:SxtJ family membrane protein [Alphaproteobacteria bacterium]|nr:SxtJ family membrane protein [Alphaproteobacteria bacterium]